MNKKGRPPTQNFKKIKISFRGHVQEYNCETKKLLDESIRKNAEERKTMNIQISKKNKLKTETNNDIHPNNDNQETTISSNYDDNDNINQETIVLFNYDDNCYDDNQFISDETDGNDDSNQIFNLEYYDFNFTFY